MLAQGPAAACDCDVPRHSSRAAVGLGSVWGCSAAGTRAPEDQTQESFFTSAMRRRVGSRGPCDRPSPVACLQQRLPRAYHTGPRGAKASEDCDGASTGQCSWTGLAGFGRVRPCLPHARRIPRARRAAGLRTGEVCQLTVFHLLVLPILIPAVLQSHWFTGGRLGSRLEEMQHLFVRLQRCSSALWVPDLHLTVSCAWQAAELAAQGRSVHHADRR